MNPAKISSWLNNPYSVSGADAVLLKDLAEEYAYCQPIQYLEAFRQQEKHALSFTALKQLFPVNIVLLHSLMHQPKTAKSGKADFTKIQKEQAAENIIYPPTEAFDYFKGQGIEVANEIPEFNPKEHDTSKPKNDADRYEEQSLMVVMSFSEWLAYLQERTRKIREEEEGKKALRAMWQKQKLSEALEEESEEIPETVFTMAVNSITPEDELISESLAEVYQKQGKKDKAIELYKKLSLRNPEKKVYFAHKIEYLKKDLEI